MNEVTNIEFYNTPEGEVMIHDDIGVRVFTEKDRDVIMLLITRLTEFYPEALKSLSGWFDKNKHNRRFFEFLIVKQFLKCNFGNFDSVLDVDQFGSFHFEEVSCPLRGTCKHEGIVCKPKFNSKLSERELEVMKMFCQGANSDKIADSLFLSPATVATHKRNALQRLDLHSLAEFISYAHKNNIFKED